MHPSDAFYIILSISVIIIAIAVIVVSTLIVTLVIEARKVLQIVGKTAKGIGSLRESFSSGLVGSIIAFGESIFKNKKTH